MFIRFISCLVALSLTLTPAFPQLQLSYERVTEQKIQERLEMVHKDVGERFLRLRTMFENAGCGGDRLTEQPVRGEKYPNLVCVLPGETDEEFLVGAHFDYFRGEGAVDNWSGASLLPSLFESLAKTPRRHTFRFVAFTAEEKGLIGSRHYARAVKRNQLPRPKAMLNLDCLGLDFTRTWDNRAHPALLRRIHSIAQSLQLRIQGVLIDRWAQTDSESFVEIGVPTVSIHSLTQENFHVINSHGDKLDRLRFDDYYATYRLLAVTLASLDALPPDFSAPKKSGR